jgi:phage gp29-like protein
VVRAMTDILDIYGNPIRENELAEPQTAEPGLAYLQRTYANHPTRGITPARLAQILEDAERFNLIDQSELMLDIREKWGHCDAEMGKRERALLTLGWDIVAPDNANPAEKKATEFLKDVLDNFFAIGLVSDEEPQDLPHLDNVILGMADAIGHGFSAQEIAWRYEDGQWLPGEITHRPQSWFRLDTLTHSKIRLRDLSMDGAKLRPFGWILHKHRARSGYVSRIGLVRSLAWPYIFATFGVRDLAELLEIFGIPIRIGKHPSNASREEKLKLLQAVVGIGHNAGGVVPSTMAIDIIQAATGNAGDVFKVMIDWSEETASKIVTGQSPKDGATASHSIERREIRRDLLTTDARQIAMSLTAHLCWPMVALNMPGVTARRCPRFQFDVEEAEDIKLLADSLPKLVAVGARIPADYPNKKAKIPVPAEGEEILQPQAPVQVPTIDTESAKASNVQTAAARRAVAKIGDAEADTPSLLAAQLAEQTAGQVAEWLEVIRAESDKALDLAALKARLLEMYPELDATTMAAEIGKGLLCADLAGRFDVQRGQ